MFLTDLISVYVGRNDCGAGNEHQLRTHLRQFESYLGQRARIDHLNADTINRHLQQMKVQGSSASYRKNRKTYLVCLWNLAADEGLTTEPPRRKLVKIKQGERVVDAWTSDDVRNLVEFAGRLSGTYRTGIRKSDWWQSYLLASWDTGLRGCDLRALQRRDIRPGGFATIIQSKTGKAISISLSQSTMEAIHKTFPSNRVYVWPLWGSVEIFRREAARIIRSAGLDGSLKRLRSGSGTAAEIAHPGRGHEHLGNTRKIFERHYLAKHLIVDNRASPPPLLG